MTTNTMKEFVEDYIERDVQDQDFTCKVISPDHFVSLSGIGPTEYVSLPVAMQSQHVSEFVHSGLVPFDKVIVESLTHMQSNLCVGFFDQIHKAWLSIDSILFIWDPDTSNNVQVIRSVDETIVNLVLASPNAAVSEREIHFLLIVFTISNVYIYGVGFTNDAGRPYSQLDSFSFGQAHLQIVEPALLTTPAEQGFLYDLVSTDKGRVFFSVDDSIFELVFRKETWYSNRQCSTVNRTKAALTSLIPVLNAFRRKDDIIKVVIDDTRRVLYTLGESGTISLYDLGADGMQFSHVTSIYLDKIKKAVQDHGIGLEGVNDILSIHVVPSTESLYIALEAVTSRAIRLFFTIYADALPGQATLEVARPIVLELKHVRFPPDSIINNPVPISSTFCSKETSIFTQNLDNRSHLTVLSTSSFQNWPNFAENIAEFDVDGEVWTYSLHPRPFTPAVGKYVPPLQPSYQARQQVSAEQSIYVATSEGIHVIKRSSQFDIFRRVISEFDCESRQFKWLAQHQTPREICIAAILMLSSTEVHDVALHNVAIRVLTEYGGVPRIDDQQQYLQSQYGSGDASLALAHQGGLVEHNGVLLSHRHDAFYIYFGRIIAPLWTHRISSLSGTNVINRLPMNEVEVAVCLLKALLVAVDSYNVLTLTQATGRAAASNALAVERENKSLEHWKNIATLTLEFLNLWRILADHQVHVITKQVPELVRARLVAFTVADCVTHIKDISSPLVEAIIKHYLGDDALTSVIRERLNDECPSLFTIQDALIMEAGEYICAARQLPIGPERRTNIDRAVETLKNCLTRSDFSVIAEHLATVGAYDAIARLALIRVHKVDPLNIATKLYRSDTTIDAYDASVERTFAARQSCYDEILRVLNSLQRFAQLRRGVTDNFDLSGAEILPVDLAVEQLNAVADLILGSDDELAHATLFDWMIENGQRDQLVQKERRFLEDYLNQRLKKGQIDPYLELLWKYYERHENFLDAAQLLFTYAKNPGKIDLKSRLLYLSHALLCIQSASDSRSNYHLKQDIKDALDVAQIQQMTIDEVERLGSQGFMESELRRAKDRLNAQIYDLNTLIAEFAIPLFLPRIKLAVFKSANHTDAQDIENAWEEILAQDLDNLEGNAAHAKSKFAMTLSKLYRTYGYTSPEYVPFKFIFSNCLARTFALQNPQWLPALCRDCEIPITELLRAVSEVVREDSFWQSNDNALRFLVALTKNVVEDFLTRSGQMLSAERSVYKNECIAFIAMLRLNAQTPAGYSSPVQELAVYEERLEHVF